MVRVRETDYIIITFIIAVVIIIIILSLYAIVVYLKYIQGTNFSALILCGTDCGWELVCVRRLRGRAGEGMHLVTYNHRGGTTCTYSYCTW